MSTTTVTIRCESSGSTADLAKDMKKTKDALDRMMASILDKPIEGNRRERRKQESINRKLRAYRKRTNSTPRGRR